MKSWASVAAAPASSSSSSSVVAEEPKLVKSVAAVVPVESAAPVVVAPVAVKAHDHAVRAGGPRKRIVVVDTNSIINNVPFASLGDQFVTVSEVLEEVRDPEARRRLEQLTMLTKLETRVPSKEAVAKVVAFANGTGDIGILSGPDIKLIALTRMIELELHGEKHLRAFPVAQAQVFTRPSKEEEDEGEENGEDGGGGHEDDQNDDESFYKGCVIEGIPEEDDESASQQHEQEHAAAAAAAAAASDAANKEASARKSAQQQQQQQTLSKGKAGLAPASLPGWGGDWVSEPTQLRDASKSETAPASAGALADEEEEGSSVSCLTADFAMQNVLLQMGLRVLSPDGKRITRAKQWALRCFTCFKITRNMEKLFCPQVKKEDKKTKTLSISGCFC